MSTLIEMQFRSNLDCSGTASSFHIFTVANTLLGAQPSDESWPIMYWQASPVYPYVPCGNMEIPMSENENCCYSSVDTTTVGTWGIGSGYIRAFNSTSASPDLSPYATTSAATAEYCYLAASSVSLTNLYGYVAVAVLKDEEYCSDGFFGGLRCFANGTLAVYYETNCADSPDMELYDLTSSPLAISASPLLGDFEASLIAVAAGRETVGWTTFLPYWESHATIVTPVDYLSLVCFILSVLFHLAACGWAVYRYYRGRVRARLFVLFSQILWLGRAVTEVAIYYIQTPILTTDDLYAYNWLSLSTDYLSNFATLSCVLYTAYTSKTLLNLKRDREIIMYVTLIALHIVLAGGRYADDACYLISTCSRSLKLSLGQWYTLNGWWTLVMMIWDVIPLTCTVYWLLSTKSNMPVTSVWRFAYKIDRTFCFILIGQVVVAVSYLLLIFLTNFSNVYGSDKTAMAMNGVETFQESLHSVLNFMMVERMTFFVRRSNLINNESKPFKTTQADGSSNPLSGQVATVLDS